VLRYLIATKCHKLRLGGLALILYIYSDADWCDENASKLDQCHATSAFWAFLADGPVAFFSKLQRITELWTTESEYKTMSKTALRELFKCTLTCAPANALHTGCAPRSTQVSVCSAAMSAVGIHSILKDLGFEQAHPTYLLTDRKGAYA